MIRNLLTPEAHRDPYIWMVVLIAHFAIGVLLFPDMGWWVIILYGAFEVIQAIYSKKPLYWDSVLDWVGVCLGSVYMWSRLNDLPVFVYGTMIYLFVLCAVGYYARSRE